MSRPAFFVAFEGCDAVGKATQSERLLQRLCAQAEAEKQPLPRLFSFPRYDTLVGQAIRRHLRREIYMAATPCPDSPSRCDDALAFECLALANKIEASVEIRSALATSQSVIADRWWPSAFAYGGSDGSSDGISDEWLLGIYAGACLPEPDLYFLLDLPAELAFKRAVRRAVEMRRALDRYETLRKQKHVRDRYLALAERFGWTVIDGSRSPDEIEEDVFARVRKRFHLDRE